MGADRSLITEALRAAVGVPTEPRDLSVDRQVARRLAEALGENPEAVAGAEFAPPYYFASFETQMGHTELPEELRSGVLAGDDWELRRPLRWGERIRCVGSVSEVYERFGGHGQTLYMRYEWTFMDSAGETVAVGRRIMVRFSAPSGEETP